MNRNILKPAAKWLIYWSAGLPLLLVADWAPFLVRSSLVFLALVALASVGLTLIMGFAGQVSLGHAAFYGIGAYAVAILTTRLGWPPLLAMLAGLILAGALAVPLGSLVFRLRGHFLAMATLAFGLVFYHLLRGAEGVTGGGNGLGNIPGLSFGPWPVAGDRAMFVLVWSVLEVGLLGATNVVDSRTGRALRAVASSEVAAAGCGVDVARAKVAVFVVGALYASLAGSLYALYVSYVSPDSFGLLVSVEFLVIATVGGLTSVWGAPLGAAFVVAAAELARESVPLLVPGATGSYEIVVYGLALLLVLLTFDRGLAGFFARATGPSRSPGVLPRLAANVAAIAGHRRKDSR